MSSLEIPSELPAVTPNLLGQVPAQGHIFLVQRQRGVSRAEANLGKIPRITGRYSS
jgi:hypothetical protein